MTGELYRRGLEIRSEVLGKEFVEAAIAGADAFNRPFQELVTTACWGGIWGDETLSRRQRSLLVLAMTAALNRSNEFRAHFRGALNNGCTLAELRATLMQVAIYCGMPAGVEAFRLAREVLRETGVDVGSLEDGP